MLSPSQPHRPPSSYLHPSLKRNEDESARFVLPTSVGWHREYKHMSRTCKYQALASWPGLYFVRHNYRRRLDPAESWLNLRCYYGKWNGQYLYAVPSWGSQTFPGWPVKRRYSQRWVFPSWIDINSCIHSANVSMLRNPVKTHFLSTSIWKAGVLPLSSASGIALGTTL